VRRVELPDDPLEDNPVVHSFEKVHTADEHRGGSKNVDGSDELQDHAAALDELDLREVVRSTEHTSSLMRSDAMIDGAAGDLMDEATPPGDGIPYDEWNEKGRAYRSAWCRVRVGTVQPRVPPDEARAFVSALRARGARHVEAVRAELERATHERRWRGRQLDGSEIDDDALVDRLATVRAGRPGDDRVYRSRRRGEPGLSVLLLIDGSLSTDAWIADRRVLDVEVESAHVIAEALDGLSIELGIAAFHSHTRRDCRFNVIKDVDEAWSSARSRVASLQPTGYTRIGPALRHGARVLSRSGARRRLLLLLTDGKPNDYDRYEGSYGVADVRQAVREAGRDGVHVHALAIDPGARFHLPKMFGAGGHSFVPRPDDLALALGRVCADMAR
jgi:nitric oxide reductase NorD protein